MKTRYIYPVVFAPEPDGRYSIHVRDLPGCVTSGESLEDGFDAARDAIGLWVANTIRHGETVPPPTPLDRIALLPNEFIALVEGDDSYLRRNTKAVRRTISLPGWLDELAIAEGLSLSQITQEAICAQIGIDPK